MKEETSGQKGKGAVNYSNCFYRTVCGLARIDRSIVGAVGSFRPGHSGI